MRRNMLILFGFIVIMIAVSCAIMTPNPDFDITFYNRLGTSMPSVESTVRIDTIRIVNNSPMPIVINGFSVEYYHNTSQIGSWVGDGTEMSVQIPAMTDSMEALGDSAFVHLYAWDILVPQDVCDQFTNNSWEEIEMRVYFTAEDGYGYGKETTKDISLFLVR
ncbi:MAG: hypothetical protein SVK54_05945 [candidate division WOR-3 bacterium]|nr:hypothetical protein [candidate division WOR-3 bacterium]